MPLVGRNAQHEAAETRLNKHTLKCTKSQNAATYINPSSV